MSKNDGGPIFVDRSRITRVEIDKLKADSGRQVIMVEGDPTLCVADGRRTLRDWFAGQVIGVLLSRPDIAWPSGTPEDEARWAYQIADAMLKEREK